MAYRVRTESFEGPFDLLLYLVSQQRVDIGAVSVSDIADQYLAQVERMKRLDLDVASDFLVVAASLLEIKAASLVDDADASMADEEFADLEPDDMRAVLLGRLVEYKRYKDAAAALEKRYHATARLHGRAFGAPAEFGGLLPDYLEGVSLDELARRFVACATRRDEFLLESEHIASKPITVERVVSRLHERLRTEKRLRFSEIAPEGSPAPVVVASLLAVLELLKRNMVTVRQEQVFGDIEVSYIEGSGALAESGAIDEYGEAGAERAANGPTG